MYQFLDEKSMKPTRRITIEYLSRPVTTTVINSPMPSIRKCVLAKYKISTTATSNHPGKSTHASGNLKLFPINHSQIKEGIRQDIQGQTTFSIDIRGRTTVSIVTRHATLLHSSLIGVPPRLTFGKLLRFGGFIVPFSTKTMAAGNAAAMGLSIRERRCRRRGGTCLWLGSARLGSARLGSARLGGIVVLVRIHGNAGFGWLPGSSFMPAGHGEKADALYWAAPCRVNMT